MILFFLQLCDKKQWTGRLFLLLLRGLRRWDYLPNPSLFPIPTVCFHHVSSPGHCTPSRPEPEGGHGPHWWKRRQRFVCGAVSPPTLRSKIRNIKHTKSMIFQFHTSKNDTSITGSFYGDKSHILLLKYSETWLEAWISFCNLRGNFDPLRLHDRAVVQ